MVSISGAIPLVEVVHLEFPLEVRHRAQSLDDCVRRAGSGEVDDKRRESFDGDVRRPVERVLDEPDPVFQCEHGLLVPWVAYHGDDNAVKQGRGAPDHVQVAVRDRVERARVDRDRHPFSSRR